MDIVQLSVQRSRYRLKCLTSNNDFAKNGPVKGVCRGNSGWLPGCLGRLIVRWRVAEKGTSGAAGRSRRPGVVRLRYVGEVLCFDPVADVWLGLVMGQASFSCVCVCCLRFCEELVWFQWLG